MSNVSTEQLKVEAKNRAAELTTLSKTDLTETSEFEAIMEEMSRLLKRSGESYLSVARAFLGAFSYQEEIQEDDFVPNNAIMQDSWNVQYARNQELWLHKPLMLLNLMCHYGSPEVKVLADNLQALYNVELQQDRISRIEPMVVNKVNVEKMCTRAWDMIRGEILTPGQQGGYARTHIVETEEFIKSDGRKEYFVSLYMIDANDRSKVHAQAGTGLLIFEEGDVITQGQAVDLVINALNN